MRIALAAALLASFCLNLVLFHRRLAGPGADGWAGDAPRSAGRGRVTVADAPTRGRRAPEDGAATAPIAPGTGTAVPTGEGQTELGRRLAATRARLTELDGVDDATAIVYSTRDLRWKLGAIATRLDGSTRDDAEKLLGEILATRGREAEVMSSLLEENDRDRLRVLAGIVEAGALAGAGPATRERLLSILRDGQPAERRLAAAWAYFPREKDRAWEEACSTAVAGILHKEPEPDVLAAVVKRLDALYYNDPPHAIALALLDEAQRLPPGLMRGRAFEMAAGADFAEDGAWGKGLYAKWTLASTPELRNDVARGYACGGTSTLLDGSANGVPQVQPQELDERRRRFIEIYCGTTDLIVRQFLVWTHLRLGHVDALDPQRASLLRRFAVIEPDPDQRARMERLADALDHPQERASQSRGNQLFGR